MGGLPSCSDSDPSACSCDIDASPFMQTSDYAYCAESSHIQNNCCASMGDNFGTMGYTFEYYNCVAPDPTAANNTLCPDPSTWINYEPLKCGPVYEFYMDLSNGQGNDLIVNPSSSDTFCCGQYNITCDQNNFVTAINWSFKNNGKKLTLPESIGNLKGIKSLDLSGNQFYSFIPQSIANLSTVEYLNLSRNSFTGPITGINFLAMTQLKVLDISFNKLGDVVPSTLALESLETLKIGHNRFSGSIPLAFSFMAFDFNHNQYNMSKANETAIVMKRHQRYMSALMSANNTFAQVGITNSSNIHMVCPNLIAGRYMTKLYFTFFDTVQNATTAVAQMNNFQTSKYAGSWVKRALNSAFKYQILATSPYCHGHIITAKIAMDSTYILTVAGQTVYSYTPISTHKFWGFGNGSWVVGIHGTGTGFLCALYVDDVLKVATGIPELSFFKSSKNATGGWDTPSFDDSFWQIPVTCGEDKKQDQFWNSTVHNMRNELKDVIAPIWHHSCASNASNSTEAYFRAVVSA